MGGRSTGNLFLMEYNYDLCGLHLFWSFFRYPQIRVGGLCKLRGFVFSLLWMILINVILYIISNIFKDFTTKTKKFSLHIFDC